MYLLQVIPEAPKSTSGLLLGAVFVLAGVVVALAMYIRHLHNRNTSTVLKYTDKIITVTSEVKNALVNNTEAIKELRQSNDIQMRILEATNKNHD